MYRYNEEIEMSKKKIEEMVIEIKKKNEILIKIKDERIEKLNDLKLKKKEIASKINEIIIQSKTEEIKNENQIKSTHLNQKNEEIKKEREKRIEELKKKQNLNFELQKLNLHQSISFLQNLTKKVIVSLIVDKEKLEIGEKLKLNFKY